MAMRGKAAQLATATLFVIFVTAFAQAMLHAQATEHWEKLTLSRPMFKGVAVDACVGQASGCGPLAAHEFCRTQGFERATAWATGAEARTRYGGSGQFCQGGVGAQCKGLRDVTCERPAPPADGRSFPRPLVNDLPVDGCLILDAACGQPAAEQFCRSSGFSRATYWSVADEDATWNIGSRKPCSSDGKRQCQGLRNVICVGGGFTNLSRSGLRQLPRSQFDRDQFALPGGALSQSPVTADLNSVHVTEEVKLLQNKLPRTNFAKFYADVSLLIDRYGQTSRSMSTTVATEEVAWNNYYQFSMREGTSPVEEIYARLHQLEKLLLTPARAALAKETADLIARYNSGHSSN